MTQIRLKRVYEDVDKSDGFRVLVDRLWPRGVRKEALPYDLWAKEIAPSSEIRKWFHKDPQDKWEKFSESYRKELNESGAVKDFVSQIKKYDVVTLLYASKNSEQNHALILKKYLEEHLKSQH